MMQAFSDSRHAIQIAEQSSDLSKVKSAIQYLRSEKRWEALGHVISYRINASAGSLGGAGATAVEQSMSNLGDVPSKDTLSMVLRTTGAATAIGGLEGWEDLKRKMTQLISSKR